MFSLDTTGLLDQAAAIFNGMQGIVVIVAGLGLGFALLGYVASLIQKAVRAR